MKVLIAAEYEDNYLTIGGIPVHARPEVVAGAQAEAQELVRALAYEAAEERFKDLGPEEIPEPPLVPTASFTGTVTPGTLPLLTEDETESQPAGAPDSIAVGDELPVLEPPSVDDVPADPVAG